ncbi:PTS mannitol transporter subunit IICBA [Clostridium sp. Cult1]|uniref:PTS mannitol transporter subunit IICBA n=1 Tax=Clostridium sp. Cult1 TaxID=2079002 RepID=UPI001F007A3B|nr:PTS mannitol transporter subunit IICBA [Clostridium sp. Cult1]MCF6463637.1 PTS mannitol transporter subunit IICBA [Clostridium sp. Cult1]
MTESYAKKDNSFKVKVQNFGRFLSGMVMPNIGAFIAWGLITALFIPAGWIPNERLAALVDPMINFLLPLLIGYTGGKMIGGTRGGVVGAVATMGVIVGVDIPMFLGAMIMGPLGGYVIKKFDENIEGRIKTGFEMLINNFSAGIIGMILAIVAYLAIGPVVSALNTALGNAVNAIVNAGLLPLSSIFVEPAKILFLNNAINHGVLGPIGMQEAQEVGKSIFFLIETNPGPGLGILLAYLMFGKKSVKQSTPSAIIIHFLGGIHEIYFPYVLMNPALILAVIAGGASGVLVFSIFNAGLVATPSPGSIFALLAMTPKGSFIGVLFGVLISIAVSFLVASIFVKSSSKDLDEEELEKATQKMKELKNKEDKVRLDDNINKIIFACDAGMGSSAMGASLLKDRIKKAGLDIGVINCAIEDIPNDADVIITHKNLTDRAKRKAPGKRHISIDDFVSTPIYDELVTELVKKKPMKKDEKRETNYSAELNNILKKENILLGLESTSKKEAIDLAGKLLVDGGYVKPDYVDLMHKREEKLSTYIGNGVAIPHGDKNSKNCIIKSGIVILQFPEGIDFGDDNIAYLVIGIAGKDNEHLSILSNIASILGNEKLVEAIVKEVDKDIVYKSIIDVD